MTPTAAPRHTRTPAPMQDHADRISRPAGHARWLLAYALFVAYSSTVIGPSGLNFVAQDPASAWREFSGRAFTWVDLGSDQRADWMGNLIMLLPLGFLLAGSLWPRRDRTSSPLAAWRAGAAAVVLGVAYVLALKYAQIYFPPRTVMLNYVVAQSIGAFIGIIVFAVANTVKRKLFWRGPAQPRETLRLGLIVYAIALCLFFLMPLDFALNRADLRAQLDKLPSIVSGVPGAERSLAVQASLLVASAVATMPLGMLLVLGPRGRNRSPWNALARGSAWMAGLLLLSTLVIGGSPTLVSLGIRIVGVGLGAVALRWLLGQDLELLLFRLRHLSAWVWLPYLLLLLAVNGLLSLDWRTPAEAARASDPLGLLPLYDYYIVSKGTAARNIVAHAVMYAPIGVLAWLNGTSRTIAATGAAVLATAVEAGRYLRPGLEGDINAVAVAALAAYAAARAMPVVWSMFRRIARSLA